MQIVIDIPEDIYQYVVNTGTYGHYHFNSARAIRKGTPLNEVLDKIRADIQEYIKMLVFSGRDDLASAAGNCLRIIEKEVNK